MRVLKRRAGECAASSIGAAGLKLPVERDASFTWYLVPFLFVSNRDKRNSAVTTKERYLLYTRLGGEEFFS